jgi:hypothetical protein
VALKVLVKCIGSLKLKHMIFNEYSKSLCSMSFKSSFIVRKKTVRNIKVLGGVPTVDDADVPAVIHIGEQDVDSNEFSILSC